MYKLYVLKDPDTLLVRYVGVTKQKIEKRYKQHICTTSWKGKRFPGNRKALILINIKTNEEREFPSITEAAKFLGCNRMNFSMIIAGKFSSVFGYTCKYKN